MALPIRFLPHSVNLAGVVAAWINQIESVGPDAGITLFEESAGSGVDREFVATKDLSPTLPITTSDLTFLTTCGMGGVSLVNAATTLTAYARELPFGALPTAIATTHHIKMVCTDGILVPVSIRASHNGVAKLSLMLHGALGSGGSSSAIPFVFTNSVAITSGAGNVANVFTTGPIKYTVSGGSSRLLQGISDINVDFGIQVFKESTDGDVYPTHISIIARMSKIEFSTKDVDLIGEASTGVGDGISVSAFAAYFRNVAANGQRVAAATATHVSAVGTAGMITPGALSLNHKTAGTQAFTYTPALNTNLLTLSATAAIPVS